MVKMRCATAIAKFLEKAGTKYYFGYNGHGNWGLLDSLEYESKIKGIRVRSEDHAVHMAEGDRQDNFFDSIFFAVRRAGEK